MSQSTSNPATGSGGPKPLIMILALDKSGFYNEMYENFNTVLGQKAAVEHITTPSDTRLAFQGNPKPSAVLAVDGSLTVSTRLSLVHEAASYVRSGGVLIFMGLFSSFSRPPDITALFTNIGLPWSTGDYHRTTLHLNPAMTQIQTTGLPSSYSQKAVHLANVAQTDAVYLPNSASRIESAVFRPDPVEDRTQSPAVFASLGQGYVGYLGDVNNEDSTVKVALAMCSIGG